MKPSAFADVRVSLRERGAPPTVAEWEGDFTAEWEGAGFHLGRVGPPTPSWLNGRGQGFLLAEWEGAAGAGFHYEFSGFWCWNIWGR